MTDKDQTIQDLIQARNDYEEKFKLLRDILNIDSSSLEKAMDIIKKYEIDDAGCILQEMIETYDLRLDRIDICALLYEHIADSIRANLEEAGLENVEIQVKADYINSHFTVNYSLESEIMANIENLDIECLNQNTLTLLRETLSISKESLMDSQLQETMDSQSRAKRNRR